MQWNGVERWIYKSGPVDMGQYRSGLLGAVDRMTPGDMPDFEPGMLLAEQGFGGLMTLPQPPAVKHMIVISDGDPGPPSNATINRLRAMGVTISTVAVDAHGTAESANMSNIASMGGGKYYSVKQSQTAKALPRIFQKEARRVSRPLLYEQKSGFAVKQKTLHEMLAGVDELPPIKGYVLTSKKDNPLVETVLFATKPGGEDNTTILAGWNYGLGRAVAFTTDAGLAWTSDWPNRPVYDKLFGQVIRWSMRPSGSSGKFTTTFEPQEGRMRVVITALDNNDKFLNFLTMSGTAVGPDLKNPIPVEIEQVAPGRYVGSFQVHDPGSYFVTINPGRGMTPLRTGVTVPYSAEFRDRGPNEALIAQLASPQPKDGPPGKIIEDKNAPENWEKLHAVNTFRHDLPKAASSQEIWHWLILLASCVFLGDVFIRRVNVNFDWLLPLWTRALDIVLRREAAPAQPQYIERLKSRKAEVTGHLEQIRAATRFEAPRTRRPTWKNRWMSWRRRPPPRRPAARSLRSPRRRRRRVIRSGC